MINFEARSFTEIRALSDKVNAVIEKDYQIKGKVLTIAGKADGGQVAGGYLPGSAGGA